MIMKTLRVRGHAFVRDRTTGHAMCKCGWQQTRTGHVFAREARGDYMRLHLHPVAAWEAELDVKRGNHALISLRGIAPADER